MKPSDQISSLINSLETSVSQLKQLKNHLSSSEIISSAELEVSSAEYKSSRELASELEAREIELMSPSQRVQRATSGTSAETSAEYTSAEPSAETSSEYTSSEYTSAETSAETSGGFFLDGSPPSWPSFKYLKGEIRGNLTKTRTMAMDEKGFIHSLGYKSDMHIQTDTLEDTIERKDQGYKGFIGNVEASDGYTYFLPAYSSSIGKLKRSTGEITLEKKKDLHTLSAMGFTRSAMKKTFQLEGMLISIIGGGGGIAVGLILCLIQQNVGLLKLQEGGVSPYYPIEIQLLDIISVVLIVAVIGFICSWLPTRWLLNKNSQFERN